MIIRGIPGSGKTTIATEISKRLSSDSFLILDPDLLGDRTEVYQDFCGTLKTFGVSEKFFPYRFLLAQARDALMLGKTVVWDQPFTDQEGLAYTVRKLRKEVDPNLRALIIEVNVPIEIARARIKDRKIKGGHGPSDDVFDSFIERYRSLAGDTSLRIIAVDGSGDLDIAVSVIVEAVEEINGDRE